MESYRKKEIEFVDTNKLIIREIDKKLSEDLIIKFHYSHKFSLCKIAYGIFYITDKQSEFFDATEEKLIGTIVYSQPAGRSSAESISKLIKVDECMELIRLVILNDYGKNIESWFISQSLKLLKKDFPQIKCVITYADGEQNHRGIIYQACNMHYQGCGLIALMPNYSVSFDGPPNYKWIHSRTISSQYGSHNVEHLKKKIGHTFWRKKESNKHRYFCLLGNKKEKKEILQNLKHPTLPYPKESTHKDEIEQIVVDNTTENRFFG